MVSQKRKQLLKKPPTTASEIIKSFPNAARDQLAGLLDCAPGNDVPIEILDPSNPMLGISKDTPCVELSSKGAIVLLPKSGAAAHKIFHELLHLHRYWVQRKPQLAHDTASVGVPQYLEDVVEHLSIVPVEVSIFPEALGYWKDELLTNFSSDVKMPLVSIRRIALTSGYVLANKLSIKELLPQYQSALAEIGFADDLPDAIKLFEICTANKNHMWDLLDAVSVPTENVSLRVYDVSNDSFGVSRVPRR